MKNKTKGELLELRKKVAGLEASRAELKQAKEALRESEELHRLTLSNISDAVFITDDNGKFTYICPNANVIFGFSPEEVLSMGSIQNLIVKDLFYQVDLEALDELQNIETEIVDRYGRRHILLINMKAVSIKGGSFLFTCRDFTARRQTEKRIEHLNTVLRTVGRVNKHIAMVKSKKRLLQLTCESLTETRGYYNAWIALRDKTGKFKLTAGAGMDGAWQPLAEQFQKGKQNTCIVKALEQPDVVVIQDPHITCTGCPLSSSYCSRVAMFVRLEYRETVYGLLTVSIPIEFSSSEEERSLFRELGKNISFALYSVELKKKQKQAEKNVRIYQTKLRSMASRLTLTEERERRRIAIELHDCIGQNLAISKIKLGALQNSIGSGNISRPLKEIRELVDQAIRDTRSLTFDLSPPILYELGFEAALEWLSENISKQHGIPVKYVKDSNSHPVNEHTSVIIFQTVRELLLNVVKHAKTNSVCVSVMKNGRNVYITVKDDGKGFDISGVNPYKNTTGGFGLFSIRERLNYIGGELEINSKPGHGTKVIMRLPLNQNKKLTA
ncbi:MAG: PAS domain S-box protein [Spirochaetes bacterium]|nr:PAS domain S-box protein [Spirochaetota bacterium]